MKPARYRKRPVVIDAMLVTPKSRAAAIAWAREHGAQVQPHMKGMLVHTLEGSMLAPFGHYLIRGVENEFYPCHPSIFDATYEPAPDEAPEP